MNRCPASAARRTHASASNSSPVNRPARASYSRDGVPIAEHRPLVSPRQGSTAPSGRTCRTCRPGSGRVRTETPAFLSSLSDVTFWLQSSQPSFGETRRVRLLSPEQRTLRIHVIRETLCTGPLELDIVTQQRALRVEERNDREIRRQDRRRHGRRFGHRPGDGAAAARRGGHVSSPSIATTASPGRPMWSHESSCFRRHRGHERRRQADGCRRHPWAEPSTSSSTPRAILRITPFLDIERAEWNDVIGVNLTGTFFLSQAAARIMVANKTRGRIVNVSSVHAVVSEPNAASTPRRRAGSRR